MKRIIFIGIITLLGATALTATAAEKAAVAVQVDRGIVIKPHCGFSCAPVSPTGVAHRESGMEHKANGGNGGPPPMHVGGGNGGGHRQRAK